MTKTDDFPNLIDINEAAALIALKPSTLRAWVLNRRIPFVRVGRLLRFKKSDLLALVEKNSVAIRENQ
jgi:excisionase family DNA binding protein